MHVSFKAQQWKETLLLSTRRYLDVWRDFPCRCRAPYNLALYDITSAVLSRVDWLWVVTVTWLGFCLSLSSKRREDDLARPIPSSMNRRVLYFLMIITTITITTIIISFGWHLFLWFFSFCSAAAFYLPIFLFHPHFFRTYESTRIRRCTLYICFHTSLSLFLKTIKVLIKKRHTDGIVSWKLEYIVWWMWNWGWVRIWLVHSWTRRTN